MYPRECTLESTIPPPIIPSQGIPKPESPETLLFTALGPKMGAAPHRRTPRQKSSRSRHKVAAKESPISREAVAKESGRSQSIVNNDVWGTPSLRLLVNSDGSGDPCVPKVRGPCRRPKPRSDPFGPKVPGPCRRTIQPALCPWRLRCESPWALQEGDSPCSPAPDDFGCPIDPTLANVH